MKPCHLAPLKRRIAINTAILLAAVSLVMAGPPDRVAADHGLFNGAMILHWADTGGTLSLRFGDNVDAAWRTRLQAKLTDLTLESWNWVDSFSPSTVAGDPMGPYVCNARLGIAEVCNSSWEVGSDAWPYPPTSAAFAEYAFDINRHFITGRIRLNDAIMPANDTSRRWLLCQEIGHLLGLDHRPNDTGTCMRNPVIAGQTGNDQPDAHDHQYVDNIYYGHNDAYSTCSPC